MARAQQLDRDFSWNTFSVMLLLGAGISPFPATEVMSQTPAEPPPAQPLPPDYAPPPGYAPRAYPLPPPPPPPSPP